MSILTVSVGRSSTPSLDHVIWKSLTVTNLNYSTGLVNAGLWVRAHTMVCVLKANMNSYILLQTAAIFFSIEPLSKTGYWQGVCHGWFHLQGLTRGVKNASRMRITKLKSLAHCGIRTGDLPFTKRARYHWATKTDVSWTDKNLPGFTCAIFRNLPVAHVRCSKIICHLFLSYDICIVLLFTN